MNPKQNTRNRKLYTLPFAAVAIVLVLFLSQIQFAQASTLNGVNYDIFTGSPARNMIAANAVYTRETRIGSFRPGYQAWGCPVYRIPASEVDPLVTITNTYSGRVENWPIPTSARPAAEADGHMCIVNLNTMTVYEFFEATWTGTRTMTAGGMVAFPMNSTGISNPPSRRVTASGFANMYGMVKREDFLNSAGQIVNTGVINHALTLNLPPALLGSDTYVSPAVGGEVSGNATSNGIPMGALFALPRSLNVDTLNVDPAVRAILRAARDYGLYVADGASAANFNGTYAGNIETEPGVISALYGGTVDDNYLTSMQSQIYSVISQYGLYRVTAGTGPVPTNTPIVPTATAIFTSTSVPTIVPTIRPTNTVVPPTSTPRPTNTVVPPTSTPRPTNTVVPPTSTPRPTNTVVPPTSTPRPTNTVVPPTSTLPPTNTPVGPTPRPTDIGGGQEVTPTSTLPPTNTPRPTNTVVPTTVPPTSTPRPTNTVVPPTSTPRPTTVPPTSTPRPTTVPPTSTPLPTTTAGLGAHIVVPTNIYVGTNFTVNFVLDNPTLAAGGGVSAVQIECNAGPSGRLTGRAITNGSLFGPSPVIVTQTNLTGTYMLYAVSQSGTNPAITRSGTIVSISIHANTRGAANVTCTGEVIAANGTSVTLNIPVANFTIR